MKFIKKSDWILIGVLVVSCLAGWLVYRAVFAEKPAAAEIYDGGQLVETIDLTKGQDRVFSVPQKPQVVFHLFEDGSICFEQSDCPDKICVHAGRLRMIGQSTACIPNGIVLKIVAKDKHSADDIDVVVG